MEVQQRMTPARGICALPKDGLASQKRDHGLRKVLKSPSSSIAKRHGAILPCIFWCLAGIARSPRSTSRVAGPVRRVTCTKNKLIFDFTPSSHASRVQIAFRCIPTTENAVGCTITHDSLSFPNLRFRNGNSRTAVCHCKTSCALQQAE